MPSVIFAQLPLRISQDVTKYCSNLFVIPGPHVFPGLEKKEADEDVHLDTVYQEPHTFAYADRGGYM